jgi:hypothetical protein
MAIKFGKRLYSFVLRAANGRGEGGFKIPQSSLLLLPNFTSCDTSSSSVLRLQQTCVDVQRNTLPQPTLPKRNKREQKKQNRELWAGISPRPAHNSPSLQLLSIQNAKAAYIVVAVCLGADKTPVMSCKKANLELSSDYGVPDLYCTYISVLCTDGTSS